MVMTLPFVCFALPLPLRLSLPLTTTTTTTATTTTITSCCFPLAWNPSSKTAPHIKLKHSFWGRRTSSTTITATTTSSTTIHASCSSSSSDLIPSHAEIPSSALDAFKNFFVAQPGVWNSERTYHYIEADQVERSQTTFEVEYLEEAVVSNVLKSTTTNTSTQTLSQDHCQGFCVKFYTKMESQEELVCNSTNLVFVPETFHHGVIYGRYIRDVGYEENVPTPARFQFVVGTNDLIMITFYTRTVSVDQMTLTNPSLRVRRILNYDRPAGLENDLNLDRKKLDKIQLAGFGIEKKGQAIRLVPKQPL